MAFGYRGMQEYVVGTIYMYVYDFCSDNLKLENFYLGTSRRPTPLNF